jgi:hypothetical protein
MDPKKQDLSPELKEVYERVMNTQAPAAGAPTTPNAAPQSGVTQPTTPQPTPPTPAAPTTVVAPATPETPKPAEGAPQVVTPATPGPTSFSFSGNKMTTPQGTTTSNSAKKKLPPFVIPIGVVVLIIAWAALWAKVFGLF